MNYLKDYFFRQVAVQNKTIFGTQTNRYFDELTSSYIIEITVKGLAKENLDISTKNNMIHINGNVQKIEKTANSSHTSSSQFSQSYSLPNNADKNSISTKFKKGMLIISIPKKGS
ncbi:Small heat shock protein [uncultured Candidatus Thioglobus sp.]|nr:Small heat shock protein [uncultured Candidatus Thioglobus sp.]